MLPIFKFRRFATGVVCALSCLIFVSLTLSTASAFALNENDCDSFFTGNALTAEARHDWSDTLNWTNGHIPLAGETVCVVNDIDPTYLAVEYINLPAGVGGSNLFASLTVDNVELRVTGGSLGPTDILITDGGSLRLQSGSITSNGIFTEASSDFFHEGGTLDVDQFVTQGGLDDSTINWSGGTLGGAGVLTLGPDVTWTIAGGNKSLGEREIDIVADTTVDLTSDGDIAAGTAGFFHVEMGGTLLKSVGVIGDPQYVDAKVEVEIGGLVDTQSGVFVFNYPGTETNADGGGEFRVSEGAWQDWLRGTHLLKNATFSGAGTHYAGSYDCCSHATVGIEGQLTISSGAIFTQAGSSTVTVEGVSDASTITGGGTYNWDDGWLDSAGALTIADGTRLNLSGPEHHPLDGTFNLRIEGEMYIPENQDLIGTSADAELDIVSGGELRKPATGTSRSEINAVIDNDGFIDVAANELIFTRGKVGVVSTGYFSSGNGAEIGWRAGYHELAATYQGGGTFRIAYIDCCTYPTINFTGTNTILNIGATLSFESGVLDATGDVNFEGPGDFRWTGGSIRGTGNTYTIGNTTTMTMEGPGGELWNTRLVNNGAVFWKSGNFTMRDNAVWDNNSAMTLTTGQLSKSGSTPEFHNNATGSIGHIGNSTTGDGNDAVEDFYTYVSLENDGYLSAGNTGTAAFRLRGTNVAGETSDGDFNTFNSDGYLGFHGGSQLWNNVDFTGSGVMQIEQIDCCDYTVITASGTVTIAAGATLLQDGGGLRGTFNVAGAGTVKWNGGGDWGTAGTTTINSTARLLITNGAESHNIDKLLVNEGLIEISGDAYIGYAGANAKIVNTGDIRKTAGAGKGFIDVAIDNTNGLIQSESGEFALWRSDPTNITSDAGVFAATAGSTLVFEAGDYQKTTNATFNGGGTILLRNRDCCAFGTLEIGGTTTVDAGTTLRVQGGGTLRGTSSIGGSGRLEWAGGSFHNTGQFTLGETLDFALVGTVGIEGARIIEVAGDMTMTGDADVLNGTGTLHLLAGSTLTRTTPGTAGGDDIVTFYSRLDNDGLVHNTAGRLWMWGGSGSTVSTGEFKSDPGTTTEFNRAVWHMAANQFTGGGTFRVTNYNCCEAAEFQTGGATLYVGVDTTFELTGGGYLNGEMTFAGDGTFRWGGGNIGAVDNINFSNSITVDVFGNVDIPTGKTLEINGTFNVLGEADLTGGGKIHVNAGATLRKSSAGGTDNITTISPVLDNDGVVQSQNGKIWFYGTSGANISTGDWTADTGTELRFHQGTQKMFDADFNGDGNILVARLNCCTVGYLDLGGTTTIASDTTFYVEGDGDFAGDAVLAGTGTVQINGNLWTSGTLTIGAGLTTNIPNPLTIAAGRTVEILGTVSLVGEPDLAGSGTVHINPGAKLQKIGTGVNDNILAVDVNLDNDGEFSIATGGVFLWGTSSASVQTGDWVADPGSFIKWDRRTHHLSDAEFKGGGDFRFYQYNCCEAATMDLAGTTSVDADSTLELSSGAVITGDATIAGPGKFRWNGGNLLTSGTLTLNADLDTRIDAANVGLSGARVVDVKGTVRLEGDYDIVGDGTLHLSPGAVLRKPTTLETGDHISTFDAKFDNDGGTLDIDVGKFWFFDTSTAVTSTGGTWNADADAELTWMTGVHNMSGVNFTGAGLLQVEQYNCCSYGDLAMSGTNTIAAGTKFRLTDNGNMSGTFTLNGPGEVEIGTADQNAGIFATRGTVTTGGNLLVHYVKSPVADGTRDIINGARMQFDGDWTLVSGAIRNTASGSIVKSGGTGTTFISDTFGDNLGRLEAQTGTLRVNDVIDNWVPGTSTLGGDYTAANDASVRINATPVSTITGTVSLSGTGKLADLGGLDLLTGLDEVGAAGTLHLSGAASRVVDSSLAVNGDLHVTGNSTLTVDGDLNVGAAGAIDVEAGSTLVVTGTILNAGTLSGTGSIDGNVINNGAVSPGYSPGTLSIIGTYNQSATGTLEIEIVGVTAGQFDVLNVSGAATFADGAQINLSAPTYVPVHTHDFVPFVAASITGTPVANNPLVGNWSMPIQLNSPGTGSIRFDVVDTASPAAPGNVASTAHLTDGSISTDNTIEVSWDAAVDDESGTDGYAYEWTLSPLTAPTAKTVEGDVLAATSPELADGSSWYFHILALDNEGNLGQVVHLGPFKINTTAPDTLLSGSPPASSTSTSRTISFTSEALATFICQVDTGPPGACTSPVSLSSLTLGQHTFSVTATDEFGTPEVEPLAFDWWVETNDPQTTITSGPSNNSVVTVTTATFEFTQQGGSSTECKLDSGAFATCASPKVYTGLSEAAHTFTVRSKTSTAVVDATPEVRNFRVDQTTPNVFITSGPTGNTQATSATLAFTTDEPVQTGVTVTCALDGAGATACASPVSYTSLALGSHTVVVVATDAAAHVSAPVSRTWVVDATTTTEVVSGTVPEGGSVSLDPTVTEPTVDVPVLVSVMTPVAGNVSISDAPITQVVSSAYSLGSLQINISAPTATASAPLRLEFALAPSEMPVGATAATLAIFRNGALVPACTTSNGTATPNPCVSQRTALVGGGARIIVLTAQASSWNFGVADTTAPLASLTVPAKSTAKVVTKGGLAATVTSNEAGTGTVTLKLGRAVIGSISKTVINGKTVIKVKTTASGKKKLAAAIKKAKKKGAKVTVEMLVRDAAGNLSALAKKTVTVK